MPDDLRERFRFTQGQYLTLRTHLGDEEVRRSYSICSATSDPYLRVAVKRVADGRFSTWAHENLQPGHVIDVAPPDGRFHVPLAAESRRHYLGFAAGSGITPLLSIVKTTLEQEPHSRFTLVYGNRSSSTVMFRQELLELKDRYLGRLAILFVMSREPQDVELFHGRIDRAKCDELFARLIDLGSVDVTFVCGPEAMTNDVVASLGAHGMDTSRVKTELFLSAAGRGPSARAKAVEVVHGTTSATVTMDGQTRAFTIDRGGETVLEAGLRQGIDLPYSCKGGVCSTCRAVLKRGEVDMDHNYVLEDYEIARGFILMCQSHPVTSELQIDLDAVPSHG